MRNRLKRPERLKRRERLGTLDRTNRVWRERLALLFAAAIGRGNFEITEATIAETHAAMRAGKLTCRQLVEGYLRRIRAFDQPTRLNAIVVVNPNALAEADKLDQEFKRTGKMRPLHGIPVIVKDNYDTFDLQ